VFGSIGLPELIVIGSIAIVAAIWPVAFFALGYYFGRRSMRNPGVPSDSSAASTPPHV
jgi:hypothetical protein